jgi:uncharacterized protein YndB with AHSA1/START domain
MVEQKNRLSVATPTDREFVMTRSFDAPRRLVFGALTKPEHIVRWFGSRQVTLAVCEVDLRVGGSARYVWRFGDDSEMGITDVYREIVPPERIVFAETFDDPYKEEMGGETINTFKLEERDGRTTLTATTLYKSREDRDRALATGMEEGAAESFDLLEELLATLNR